MNESKESFGYRGVLRKVRALAYLSFVIGSGIGIIYPSTTISVLTMPGYAVSWSILSLIASSICFVGVLIGNWVVEYIGLPLLSVVFLILAICLFLSINPQTMSFLTFGFMCTGISILLFARYRELNYSLRFSKKMKKAGNN